MSIRFQYIFCCIIAGLIFWGSDARAERLTWYQPDFPPYVILHGPQKDFGVDNVIQKEAAKWLSGMQHGFEVANYSRILTDLKLKKRGIVTPIFRTAEREKYILYTNRPSYWVFPNGFIYHKDDRERFAPFLQKDGTIDLEAMHRSGKFSIGINAGRSYSGIIDKVILGAKGGKGFVSRATVDHLGILKMVAMKRVDGAFGFPVEIKYANLGNELRFFHVSNMVLMTPVYFGAPKSSFGERVIRRLNVMLQEDGLRERFADAYMYWLDKELRQEYQELVGRIGEEESPAP